MDRDAHVQEFEQLVQPLRNHGVDVRLMVLTDEYRVHVRGRMLTCTRDWDEVKTIMGEMRIALFRHVVEHETKSEWESQG